MCLHTAANQNSLEDAHKPGSVQASFLKHFSMTIEGCFHHASEPLQTSLPKNKFSFENE